MFLRMMARLLGDRRVAVSLSVAGLAVTLLASFFASGTQAVGPTMLLPWVALLAFELGPWPGLAAALVSFSAFLASSEGLTITPTFVVGRFASFALIALGVGVAGKRLRDSEQRSRRLVEGLPLVMYTENEGGLTYIGPQIERLVGYPTSEWRAGSLWRKALHPDDLERVLAQYAVAVAAAEPFECEYRLVGPDGRTVWVRDSSAAVAAGSRHYRQGFIVDITDRKQTELELERNAVLMRGLIDRTVDGIALTDRDGRIVIANEPMLRFTRELEIPLDGPIHERLLAIADQMSNPSEYAQRMSALASTPDEESFDEFELRESRRVFQGFTRAVVSSDQQFLGRVWTLREVTEARQVDRIKDALVATVSHELRTPLTSVIGYLELLGESALSSEDAGYIEIAGRNAMRLQQMVDDLLFLSRVDAEGMSLEITDVDLVDAARHAIGSARPLAEAKKIALDCPARPPVRVRADPKRINQVFDNLLSNAIKFTPAGGTVEVSIDDRAGEAVISVSDDGCGIPASEQDHVFNRFFRSSTSTHAPGTGLGLAIAKTIVEKHGGSMAFESIENEGTTFTFSLPAATPARSAEALEATVS
jgi:PAS domain S-box-containing protein